MYAAASAAILIPCFWQSRLQAGDLASHLYNAWLAGLVEHGQAPGLAIARQTTNVLFDLLLKFLLEHAGAEAAQRISVSLAVLVFVWGAFTFVTQAAGRRPWALLPVLAMLAYGWTFQMGLFNFYLSLGLCLWAMALAWTPSPGRFGAAAALLAVAYVAHGLPVAWGIAAIAYGAIARRLDERGRTRLAAIALGAIVAGSVALRAIAPTRWYPGQQLRSMTAAEQLWVFDEKYLAMAAGLLLLWSVLLALAIRGTGIAAALAGVPFQLWALTAAGVFLMPNWIQLPGYRHALVYIADRMSLAAGVCLCAAIASSRIPRWAPIAAGGLALVFFVCVYGDQSEVTALEEEMDRLVAQLPPGQRVVSGIERNWRAYSSVFHAIDRACIGRCYSYGNYEPSSAQFRVRAMGPNGIVIADADDSFRLGLGTYVVKERDVPLYQVALDNQGQLGLRLLEAGQQSGTFFW